MSTAAEIEAAPLIVAQPYSHSFFIGVDTSISFDLLATGTAPTFQWQVSTDNGATFNNVTDGALYSNVTTPSLTITNPTAGMDLYRYRCRVTDGAITVNSRGGATLNVYTPSIPPPTVTLSASTLAANSTVDVTVHITGLSTGETVRIHRLLDANLDGKPEIGEPLVSSFLVTDGARCPVRWGARPEYSGR